MTSRPLVDPSRHLKSMTLLHVTIPLSHPPLVVVLCTTGQASALGGVVKDLRPTVQAAMDVLPGDEHKAVLLALLATMQ